MKKVIEFVKKNKFYIVSVFMVLFFIRSCSKSVTIKKMDKSGVTNVQTMDSLNVVINTLKEDMVVFPEKLRQEKLNIHMDYDNWISARDRGVQLMELHKIVKYNIKKVQK